MTRNPPTRVFAGAGRGEGPARFKYRGGLYRRSADDREWEALTRGLPEGAEVRAIAVHPTRPGVMYVGTQDGPYRSVDGGDRWERLGFPDPGTVIWTLAIHPTDPAVIYAGAAPVALYRSRDGGETWSDVSASLFELAQQPHLKSNVGGRHCGDCEGMLDSHALALSPAAPGSAFLALRMGLFRSDDRGDTWQDTEIGRFSPLTYCRDVLVSPHDPKVMYACLSQAAFSTAGSLYRSDDLARTWRRIDHGVVFAPR
jgi:photosystem II stability/assembly factor-like uncharacterized protein